MQSFYRWAVVPEWCRCLFFYDAAVFLYSSIERNDTRNFREKKIFRVALSGTLEVKRVNHILYIICLYIIRSWSRDPDANERRKERQSAASESQKEKRQQNGERIDRRRNQTFQNGTDKINGNGKHIGSFPRLTPELKERQCRLNGKDKQHNAKQSAQSCRPSGRTTSRRHNAADHPKEKRQQNGNQHHQAHTHGGKLDVEKLCHIKREKKQKT